MGSTACRISQRGEFFVAQQKNMCPSLLQATTSTA